MNELQIFNNPEFGKIRTLLLDDEPWFVGRDVAKALGYAKPENAVKAHVDDEDKSTTPIQGSAYETRVVIINESGLYSLILSSKLPNAKKFKRWVTSEVLPAIRKQGYYISPSATAPENSRITTKDDYLRAASIIAGCKNERLPYVFSLLHGAGIDLDQVSRDSGKDTSGECARLINTAINDYGMTASGIARLVGLQPTQIIRIRTGNSIPSNHRSGIIIDAIRSEIPEIE